MTMKSRIFNKTISVGALCALLSCASLQASAQVGEPFIHDPSTIAECDGNITPSEQAKAVCGRQMVGCGKAVPYVLDAVQPPIS